MAYLALMIFLIIQFFSLCVGGGGGVCACTHSTSVVVRGQVAGLTSLLLLRSSGIEFISSVLVASIVSLLAISQALSDYFTEYLLNIK